MPEKAATTTTGLAIYDPDFAAQQILGLPFNITPEGRVVTAHAAERMVNPPPGRVPTTIWEIDEFLDTATEIRKVSFHPKGDTITLRNSNCPIHKIVVDAETGNRIIMVINVKRKREKITWMTTN